MKYELHLTVPEMNLVLAAVESYAKYVQTSNIPSVKANAKSKVSKLKQTAEKLKLLISYAKISTQAEKIKKQAEQKKQRYSDLVFGSDAGTMLQADDLEKVLKID